MLKTNEFETAQSNYPTSKRRFSKEANMQYTYPSAKELIKNTDALSEMIEHHIKQQRPRLDVLDDYYEGNNVEILRQKRRKEEHLADHRATHNFAEYVSQFIQGYMVGIPLKTVYPDNKINEQLKDINRDNDADEHNSDLVLDLSIYGRAYELLLRNKQDENRFFLLSPLETFVIYDTTVEDNPIAAVRYYTNKFKDNEMTVELYTDKQHIIYTAKETASLELRLVKSEPHYFGGVPVIEYRNNRFRLGDYEGVLSLIDLYDAAQSDTSNYMSDLNDAMLVIKGNLDIDVDEAKKQKDANLLFLKTEPNSEGKESNVDAGYIYKQYDVAGTEAYKGRVKSNIHLFTSTPDMDDENFGGVQSGEAMKYKLFSLEQKRVTKERLFKKSLRDRYRLLNNILSTASEGGFDVNKIKITFTPNLPKSIKDEIDMFNKLGGQLSEETMLSILSFVENPQEELERIESERPKSSTYGFPTTTEEVIVDE